MEYGLSPCGRVHVLPGRLRVRLAMIKRAPRVAAQVERLLRRQPGVTEVIANPVTGSVLIYYDPRRTDPEVLLARVEMYDCTDCPEPPMDPLLELYKRLGKAAGKELVKLALARVLPWGPVELLFAFI
jgi:hypothetical protein